ncbi:hypothetical protein ACFL5D_04375 [Candidatus Neomarinimicrobiota bacterium]
MQKVKTNGNVIYSVIVRPKSDIKNANSKDEILLGAFPRWHLEMTTGCIIATKCPICQSENCIREFHSVGFERILCKDCEYELTFWCMRDKFHRPIPIGNSISLTKEYLTSKEFIIKNRYGIYIMELFKGGICGAAFEKKITFSPSPNQSSNIRKIIVLKIINGNVSKEVVYQSPIHLTLEVLPVATC